MIYRPEIDGLRAVAVLAVVLYHAGFSVFGHPIMAGGFLGVDVFFVISGYLICAILLKSLQQGTFHLGHFYERRVRRILPALFFMLLCCLPVAWFLLLPLALKDFAESLLASVFFFSNIHFWAQDAYTADTSIRTPLLHTWSLAVEEQFYILFPLILWLCWRYARTQLFAVFCLGGVASFAYAEWVTATDSATAFFMLPARAWQILAGAVLAYCEFKSGRRSRSEILNKTMPTLGLFCILHAVFFFSDQQTHAPLHSALAVFGSLLLIWFGGKRDLVSIFLSSKLCVVIGLISYALYLWHQPVLAFTHITFENNVTDTHKGLALLGAFFMAYLSWRFVETPFRNAEKTARKTVFLSVICAGVICSGLAFYILNSKQSWPSFLATSVHEKIEPWHIVKDDNGDTCWGRSCTLLQDNPADQHLILIGDSHLAALSPLFFNYAKQHNMRYSSFTYPGCHINYGLEHAEDGQQTYCSAAFMKKILKYLAAYPKATVILHNNLSDYMMGEQFGGQDWGYLRPVGNDMPTEFIRNKTVAGGIQRALRDLIASGRKIILIAPTPSFKTAPADNIQKFCATSDVPCLTQEDIPLSAYTVKTDDHRDWTQPARDIYDSLPAADNLIRIDPTAYFCDTFYCTALHADKMLYWDHHHLNRHGAAFLGQHILKHLNTSSGDP